MTEAKHTPLPWYERGAGNYIFADANADPEYSGEILPHIELYDNDGCQKANAEFIVQAVNNLDALIKAGEAILEHFDCRDFFSRDSCLICQLKQALAKARGEL